MTDIISPQNLAALAVVVGLTAIVFTFFVALLIHKIYLDIAKLLKDKTNAN